MVKRLKWLVFSVFFFAFFACASTSPSYWPDLKPPITEKSKKEKICIKIKGEDSPFYKLKFSIYPSKKKFICMPPNMEYQIKKYLRSQLADFGEVFFINPSDKPLAGYKVFEISWKSSYKGYVKGGLGIWGKTYMIEAKIECEFKGYKGFYNCSALYWEPVSESRFLGPESYLCKDTPAEVFFSKAAAKAAYKSAILIRRAVLLELDYSVSAQLEEVADKIYQEVAK